VGHAPSAGAAAAAPRRSPGLIRRFPSVEVPWLEAKLVGLAVYIVAGTIARKRGRTASVRTTAFAVALLAYAYIVSVALTKLPQGWLAGGVA